MNSFLFEYAKKEEGSDLLSKRLVALSVVKRLMMCVCAI